MMTKTTKLFMLLILCLGFAAQSFGQNQKTADDYLQEGIGYFNAKNYGNAVESFQKSSSMGNHVATSNLGICYENGFGVEKASCYYFGMGVAKDVPMAKMYYEKAAAQGNENAKRNLSVLKF